MIRQFCRLFVALILLAPLACADGDSRSGASAGQPGDAFKVALLTPGPPARGSAALASALVARQLERFGGAVVNGMCCWSGGAHASMVASGTWADRHPAFDSAENRAIILGGSSGPREGRQRRWWRRHYRLDVVVVSSDG